MCPINIQANKTSYHPREKITFKIDIPAEQTDTFPASFAISVTDDKDIKLDTTTNIVAEILLVSELKGHIRNPAWYFGNDENAFYAADLLMLTHGWRRYHVEEALRKNIRTPEIKPETSQSFSGTLRNKRGKPYKNGRIKMSVVGYQLEEIIKSDDKGRYLFDKLDFPDSTAYFFLSYTNDKTTEIEIHPDKTTFLQLVFHPFTALNIPQNPVSNILNTY